MFVQKYFCPTKSFGPNKILVRKVFGTQMTLIPKKLLSKNIHNFKLKCSSRLPWGIGLSVVLGWEGGGEGINYLALDKPTYQILASY